MQATSMALASLLATPLPVGFTPAQHRVETMRAFIEQTHGDLLRKRPDLFHLKMRKAAASEKAFYRAFPNLFYSKLKSLPEAGSLASAVEVRSAGDVHADNVEISGYRRQWVPQVNDFDDSGKAPASLEIARTLGAAALLDDDHESRRDKVEEARTGYRKALRQGFDGWARSIQDEGAVKDASSRDYDWPHNAGERVTDRKLAARLHKETGLDPEVWKVHDRAGSGLSSIGMRRYMFLSDKEGFVWELKQLRASALEFFTGKPMAESDRRRLEKAFAELRRSPSEAAFLTFDGVDWLLRRREQEMTRLDYSRKSSSARVLGGLAAQMHRVSAAPDRLNKALASVSTDLVLETVEFMEDMRGALRKLLREGAWKR